MQTWQLGETAFYWKVFMSNTEFKNEVKSVFENEIGIGFITRGTVLFGWSSDIDTTRWWATACLDNSKWKGPFANRKAATNYLRGLK